MRWKGRPNAFSLVEVALALGIASFALLILFALIPVGLSSKKEAIQYTIAAGIASEVVSDLRATPSSVSTATSPRFQLKVPIAGTSATMTTNPQTFYLSADGTPGTTLSSGANPSVYRVTVGFNPPSASAAKLSILVRILVTWPAQAYPNTNAWPDNLNDSFEVLTSLDRG